MDLPTYTNIWRIEKRLYKLYDLRLPMPLPIVWIGVFVGVFIPWSLLLILVGVPVAMPWHVLFLVPPGIVTWLSTRPVIEGKRLTELLESHLRYLGEPKAWYRLTPMAESETITFSARVWRTAPARAKSKRPSKSRHPQRRRQDQRIAGPRQVRPAVAAAAAAAGHAPVAEPAATRTGWGARRGAAAPALKAQAPAPARHDEGLSGGRGHHEDLPLVVVPGEEAPGMTSPPVEREPADRRESSRTADRREISRTDDARTGGASTRGGTDGASTDGGRRAGGKRAGGRRLSAREAASQQAALREAARREAATREAALHGASGQEAPGRENAGRATGAPETGGHVGTGPEAAGRPGMGPQSVAHAGTAHADADPETAGRAATGQESAARAATGQESAARAAAGQESAAPAATGQEPAARETGGRESGAPEGGERTGDHAAPGEEEAAPGAVVPIKAAQSRKSAAGKPIDTEALRRLRKLAASADAPGDTATGRRETAGRVEGERREDEVARDQHRKGQPPRLGPALVLSGTQRVWPPLDPDAKPLPRPGVSRPDHQDSDHVAGEEVRAADAPSGSAAVVDTPSEGAGTHGPDAIADAPDGATTAEDVTAQESHDISAVGERPTATQGPGTGGRGSSETTRSPGTGGQGSSDTTQSPDAGGRGSSDVEQSRGAAGRRRTAPAEAGDRPRLTPVPPDRIMTGEDTTSDRVASARGAAGGRESVEAGERPRPEPDSTGRPAPPTHDRPAAVRHDRPAAPTHDRPAAVRHDRPAAPTHDRPAAPTHDRPAAPTHDRPPAADPVGDRGGTVGGLVGPVPVPRPGEARVRRVESVIGRDSGGWRRIAQVVVGGTNVRSDGSEIDEARARAVFSGSRRIVVLGCTGGAGQSTTALMLGHTFATYRDDRVVAVDANTGGTTLTSKIQPETPETLTSLLSGLDRVSGYLTMRGYTTRTASGLEVISADTDAGAEQRLADRSFFSDHRLGESMRLLDRHYKLAVIDPAAALAARLLPYADQLVLVVPASEEASEAVAMTYEWLDGHGCAELRRRAVMVVNGVSRRSMTDVEQAESVARGRCRAIVRVPWEDDLAPGGAEIVDPGQLRAAGRRAYLALAGVVVAGFAAQTVRPSEEELASDPPGTRIGER
ncbi:TcpE family conjugal transfer membrane protein [Nonomuraea turkmeniaca]|uniref:TcpE family conjugal transfer membrane protein n=1 Tax=Nonomuraea turkmeniaca TaxID=103838 RepID=UPI001476EF62|nr:TcpE family conjugal transfer membrane protein [Nonomuraea turkmeniaca]